MSLYPASLKSSVSIIVLLLILVLLPVPAESCSCDVPIVWGFVDKGPIIPANSRGLLWWGRFDGEPDSNGRLPVHISTAEGKSLPVECERVSMDSSWGVSLWLFRPSGGFIIGSHYVFSTTTDSRFRDPEEQTVTVRVNEKPATGSSEQAELSVGEPFIDYVRVPAGISCSERVVAAQVHLDMKLPAGMEAFRDQLFFETIIDGNKRWVYTNNWCAFQPPGSTLLGKGRDLLYRSCNYDYGGLPEGRHIVQMRASLPGTDIHTETPPQTLDLICSPGSGPAKIEILERQANKFVYQKQYDRALSIAKEMLEIRENHSGPDHPDTARRLSGLASIYADKMDNFAEAEPLYRRALDILEKALGPGAYETVDLRRKLAELYTAAGDYESVEQLYKKSLNISEKYSGPTDASTVERMDELAVFYREIGEYAKAEQLYLRALAVTEESNGPEHDLTALYLKNLAGIYQTMGEYAKAVPLYDRAIAIIEKNNGHEHIITAENMESVAGHYAEMGNIERTEQLYKGAVRIYEKVSGPNAYSATKCRNNLAKWYHSVGNDVGAEQVYLRAVEISKESINIDPRPYEYALKNLASFYASLGRHGEALQACYGGIAIYDKADMAAHKITIDCMLNLITVYGAIGNHYKALRLAELVLEEYEKALGPEHMLSIIARDRLARLHRSRGNISEAIALYRTSLKISEEVYGAESKYSIRRRKELDELTQSANSR